MIFVAVVYALVKAIQWTLIAIAAVMVFTFLMVAGMLYLMAGALSFITDKTTDKTKEF